jgi:integrase
MTAQADAEPKKRGRRGEGTIYWDDEKKCYRGEMSLGYTPSGKRKRVRAYGPTKAAARASLREMRDEAESGIKSTANYTVADAVREWLDRGLVGRSANTVTKNRILANTHVVPGLGRAKLRQLTVDDVDDWLAGLSAKLATRSMRECLAILRRAITHAQRRDRVLRNVAELATVPDGQAGRPSKSMSFDQARTLMESGKRSRVYAYFVLSLLTGVRTEEARALTWDRVHLEERDGVPPHVEVWRSVRRGGDTKTRRSRRTLALPPAVVAVLIVHRERQKVQRQRADNRWLERNLVFSTRYGAPLSAQSVRRSLVVALRKADLPQDWTPRELRHSFVSLMSANGASIELIARLVGHSTSATTETVYRHELRPVITEGADIIGQIFDNDQDGGSGA